MHSNQRRLELVTTAITMLRGSKYKLFTIQELEHLDRLERYRNRLLQDMQYGNR